MHNHHKRFESIITKYRVSLFKIAVTFEADPDLQQDLLQEIMLAIWQALPSFKQQSSIYTFVYRVAYNQALTHVAKQTRRNNVEPITAPIADKNSDIEQFVTAQKSVMHLMAKIRGLPIVQRQLVVLSLEGVSYQQMSEICGLSQTNVGVQLTRAKSKLIQLMRKH